MKTIARVIMLLILSLSSVSVWGQSFVVSGTVKDDIGEGIPGVNIVIKGTTNGTLTDIDGAFSLQVSNEDVLVVSFIGMETKEVAVAGQSVLDIVLGADAELIQEVMVVAYGTSTKEAFTGAATVIDGDMLQEQPVATLDQALQGKVANVLVTSSSGQPGATSTIRIRGIGSMSASSAPLIVVDGVASSVSISTINPSDIESMTVLKDAAATSLYGSRAANGVIIITTKIGKGEEGVIRFSSKTGITQRAGNGYDLMSSDEYYQHTWKGLYNEAFDYKGYTSYVDAANYANQNINEVTGFNPYNLAPGDLFNDDGTVAPSAVLEDDVDWRDAVYRTGMSQDYSLSASGTSDDGSYFLSLGYYDETGVIIGSDYTRYNVKGNFDKKVKQWMKVGLNTSFSFSEMNSQPSSSGLANPVRAAEVINPTSPITNDDGSYNWDNLSNNDFNPVGLAEMDIYYSSMATALASMFAEISLPFDIKYRVTGTAEYESSSSTTYYNAEHGNAAQINGRSSISKGDNIALNVTNLFSWNKDINLHSLGALAGHEGRYEMYDYVSAEAYDGLIPGSSNLNGFSTALTPYSGISDWSMVSYFAQANYDYSDKYYASASIRNDGSSRFGYKKSWGAFYSLGASWRISEEDAYDVDWMDNLKLRTSIGTSGNNNIGNYASLSLYSLGANYGGASGIYPVQLAYPELTWESQLKSNIAVEATLFNRLNVIAEYYYNKSDKLLMSQPIAPSRGYTSIMTNLGAMSNSGVEFSINALLVQADKFSMTADFNIATNKNKLLSLTQDQIISGYKRLVVGGEAYQFYLKEWAGVNSADGSPLWYTNVVEDDLAADVEPSDAFLYKETGRYVTSNYEDAEYVDAGSSLPKVTGSLGSGMNYGDFSFNFNFYYSLGGKIYNSDYAAAMHDGTVGAYNLSTDALDAWENVGDDTNVPRYTMNNLDQGNSASTRYLEDGSYLRLKTISLGYSLPKSLLDRSVLSTCKFYVSADNLWTLTNYKGFDPEIGIGGETSYQIPSVKNLTFGLNVSF